MDIQHSLQKISLRTAPSRLIAALLLAGVLSVPTISMAQQPDYVLLWRPEATTKVVAPSGPKKYSNVRYVGQYGYAYGWFGVKRRRHRTISHGYYGNYTQWTFR